MSVHVYGQGNPFYEYIDRTIRKRTIHLSAPELRRFTQSAYRMRQWLDRLGVADQASRLVRLDSHPISIFSWYGAPIATHHTYDEVKGWLAESHMTIVDTRKSTPAVIRHQAQNQIGNPSALCRNSESG